MDYRDEVYVVLDGKIDDLSEEGDLMYCKFLNKWAIEEGYKIVLSDSYKYRIPINEEKELEVLQEKILDKMSNAKQMMIIMTENSNWDQQLLNFEIEVAVDCFEIPIIAAYPEYDCILTPMELKWLWPNAFYKRVIQPSLLRCIHIPFKRFIIGDALDQFDVYNKHKLKGPLGHYNRSTYKHWGI